MTAVLDTSSWPQCTMNGCGVDTFGAYHGVNCARSRYGAEQLQAWLEGADA